MVETIEKGEESTLQEEIDEELTEEELQERYRQETGRKPIYAGRKTKGFHEWREQLQITQESLESDIDQGQEHSQEVETQTQDEEMNYQSDVKEDLATEALEERKKADWKPIFKKWVNELATLMLNPYLTKLLKDIIKDFHKFEELERLYDKYVNEELTKRELIKLIFIDFKLQNIEEMYKLLVVDIITFKQTYDHVHPWDIPRLKEKFMVYVLKKYNHLMHEIESHKIKLSKTLQGEKKKEIDLISKKNEKLISNEYIKSKITDKDSKKEISLVDASLKYPFIKNDNDATKLIKIILNLIYISKRTLEKYHFGQIDKNKFTFLKGKDIFYPNQKSPNSLSQYNISIFLGVSRSKARKWLIKLDQKKNIELPNLEFRKIRAVILRLFKGEGENIIWSRQIIKSALKIYFDNNYKNFDFIAKIVLHLDECVIWEKSGKKKGKSPSLLSISKSMDMNQNYLLEIKKRLKTTESDQYSKYFTLSTNILLLKYRDFMFKNKNSFKNFKKGAVDIIFHEMVRQGIFSYENIELMKRQYKVLVYTIYALTKARNKQLSKSKLKSINKGRDNKGIFTLTDLSRKIGGRKLFADHLLYETFLSRETIAEMKNLLERNKLYANFECEFALNLLEKVPPIRLGQRSSYIGRLSHPILENFFRKLWLKLGIKSNHEYQFNYPISLHRIDSALEVDSQQELFNLLKKSSESSLNNFKSLFVDYTIPNLVKLDLCVLDKILPEKNYLTKNRAVIVVFYGIYSEKVYPTLQMRLDSLNLKYKKNVYFMDIMIFIKLFTSDAEDIRELDIINTLIKEALDDNNDKALEKLEIKADEALHDLVKFNQKKRIY